MTSAIAVAAPPRAGTNLSAVFSLVCGVLWVSPVAIVLGHIAFGQLRQSAQSGRTLAAVGLILGYLGLVVLVAVLVGLVSFVSTGPVPLRSF